MVWKDLLGHRRFSIITASRAVGSGSSIFYKVFQPTNAGTEACKNINFYNQSIPFLK